MKGRWWNQGGKCYLQQLRWSESHSYHTVCFALRKAKHIQSAIFGRLNDLFAQVDLTRVFLKVRMYWIYSNICYILKFLPLQRNDQGQQQIQPFFILFLLYACQLCSNLIPPTKIYSFLKLTRLDKNMANLAMFSWCFPVSMASDAPFATSNLRSSPFSLGPLLHHLKTPKKPWWDQEDGEITILRWEIGLIFQHWIRYIYIYISIIYVYLSIWRCWRCIMWLWLPNSPPISTPPRFRVYWNMEENRVSHLQSLWYLEFWTKADCRILTTKCQKPDVR